MWSKAPQIQYRYYLFCYLTQSSASSIHLPESQYLFLVCHNVTFSSLPVLPNGHSPTTLPIKLPHSFLVRPATLPILLAIYFTLDDRYKSRNPVLCYSLNYSLILSFLVSNIFMSTSFCDASALYYFFKKQITLHV
jgi:hypothetical protein